MHTTENNISYESEYYMYTPSPTAKLLYFYPLIAGDYTYLPGYRLVRNSYDSYLLLYVMEGSLSVTAAGMGGEDCSYVVGSGELTIIDCYKPHSYWADSRCRLLWCHFDGAGASRYMDFLSDAPVALSRQAPELFFRLLEILSGKRSAKEYVMSGIIEQLLGILAEGDEDEDEELSPVQKAAAYISSHLASDLSLQELASVAGLSVYHFSRQFSKETGLSPHRYIVSARMRLAAFLLSSTRMSVKEICIASGYNDESVFCSAFRKAHGCSPRQYRTGKELADESTHS